MAGRRPKREAPNPESSDVERHIDEFLRRGGKVNVIPQGHSTWREGVRGKGRRRNDIDIKPRYDA